MALRQALHFPGRLYPWPALFPSNYTSCSATSSVLSARGGGGRLRCGCYTQEDGWGTTPSEAQPWEASEEGLWQLSPSAVWPQAPERVGRWGSGSERPRPRLVFPLSGHQSPNVATLAQLVVPLVP